VSARCGFTLVEVMVATVVTGLVVSLAYGAAQAGFATDDALRRHRDTDERDAVVRGLVGDALRHAEPGLRGGDTTFVLVDDALPDGTANDVLQWVTRGIVPPYGASAPWLATLRRAGDTLVFDARPRDASGLPPVHAALPGVAGLDVDVLGRGSAASWQPTWREPTLTPDAVRVRWTRDGAPTSLVMRTGLERAP
jgi:prepilin-type N-terminal cleavage/methylation domain-containing protein